MNKEFIPYEQALELKELGFDEPCFAYWKLQNWLIQEKTRTDGYNHADQICSAPLYQQTFRWFREKHNLHASIYPIKQHWECDIRYTNKNVNSSLFEWDKEFTYEEAELTCLIKLIEIVKGGNK